MSPSPRRLAAALMLVTMLGPPSIARAQEIFDRLPVHLSEERQRDVLSGKNVVQLMPLGTESLTEVVAVALMDSAPERLFEVLTDVEKFPEFMPYAKTSRGERQIGGRDAARVEIRLDPCPGLRQYQRDTWGLGTHRGRAGEDLASLSCVHRSRRPDPPLGVQSGHHPESARPVGERRPSRSRAEMRRAQRVAGSPDTPGARLKN
jgi:hypothetical protein